MLELSLEYGVEDPVEPEDGIDHHSGIINPGLLIAKDIAQERVFGVWIAKTYGC